MASAGDARYPTSVPGPGRASGEGNGNPLQYSCLENSIDRGAWQATAMGPQRVECDLVNEHTTRLPKTSLFALFWRLDPWSWGAAGSFSLGGSKASVAHAACLLPSVGSSILGLELCISYLGLTWPYSVSCLFFFLISIYFWLHWVPVAASRLSLVAMQGLSLCGGFSLQNMGSRPMGSVVAAHGL